MKKILLPVIFLTSFLFSGCLNLGNLFGTFFLGYVFVNIENKNVKYIGEVEPRSQGIIIDDILFEFGLEKDWDRILERNRDRIREDVEYYSPGFVINTSNLYINRSRYIESVLINNVVVYDGKTKYSMLERVNYVSLDSDRAYYLLNEEEIANVQRTGLIDHVKKTDDEGTFINADVGYISVDFNSLPIKHNKVKILYDISVKCTTGETITINRKLTGYLQLRKVHRTWHELFWYPSA